MGLTTSRAVCALAFLASMIMAPSVLAHAHLKQQNPAADSQVTPPQVLTLIFRKVSNLVLAESWSRMHKSRL